MWLGSVPYAVALDVQNDIIENIRERQTQKHFVLGLEHPSVVTLGRRASLEADVLVSGEALDDLGIQCFNVERGGHATLHNPGQLVIYPVIHLRALGITVKDFVCVLTQTTQNFLKSKGVETFTKEKNPGLYTSTGKIAFFGLRITHGISYHGLAINVFNQLEDFSLIKSCGTDSEKFDSLNQYLIQKQNLAQLFAEWSEIFLSQLTSLNSLT